MNEINSRIIVFVEKQGKNGIGRKDLIHCIKLKSKQKKLLDQALGELVQNGVLIEKRNRFFSAQGSGLIAAEITRVNQTFGFAKTLQDETEYFVPGKYLQGAMPGDKVLIKRIKGKGISPEGKVMRITEYGSGEFTGQLEVENGTYLIVPDHLIKYPIMADCTELSGARPGDKVLAKIIYRGKRHADHRAAVISSYGDSETASACVNAALDLAGISKEFPFAVSDRAKYLQKRGIKFRDYQDRTDFRSDVVFTIDGADSKDLDDAISLEQYADCYVLGVHIADVSHYVPYKSELDREAFYRGTSIYYADQVIPMLPRELSNGICSLNPGEDRLTLSAVLTLNLEGQLIDFDFCKGVICSRVKGVYDEVNQIFAGTASPEIVEKYAEVREKLFLMKKLADILTQNKKRRGAPEIYTQESKIITDSDGIAVDIKPRVSGDAQRLIEEFMLTANEAAAMAGKMKQVPFIYRVHESPTEEKLENLNKTLRLLGLQTRNLSPNVKPKALAEILQRVKESDLSAIVNMQVLRAMSKAKYSENSIGHYGLALENYAHFTSPIRRYPDLMVHRVLTSLIEGESAVQIRVKYGKYVAKAAKQSTQTELNAMMLERDCEDCYKAEYMKSHIGEKFEGIISSVADHGIYVELDNTVEGLVRTEDLPDGQYDFDGVMQYRNITTGEVFRIGQRVKICCIKAEISSGNIDFVLVRSGKK